MPAHQVATVSDSFEQELLRLLARQAGRVPIPVMIACSVVAALVHEQAGGRPGVTTALLVWLLSVAALQLVRRRLLPWIAEQQDMPLLHRLRIAATISAVNGTLHALPLSLFALLPDLSRALQSLLLLGLCVGAVVTAVGYRPVVLAYQAPLFAALMAVWLLVPGPSGTAGWENAAVAIIVGLFWLVLMSLTAEVSRMFRESFQIRHEQRMLNERLQAAVKQAELADQAKARFLASASHDLRQPLHTVSLFAAALALRPLDEGTRAISGHINDALRVLAVQLDSLLDISRLDAGVVPVRTRVLDVGDFMARLADQYGPVAAARGVRLTVAPASPLRMLADDILLGRVIGNLLDNAIKYGGGAASLAAGACPGHVWLTVADRGGGIAPAEQQRIFEEFYQIDNPERDRSKGLGLGLAIVHRLVPLLGARLEMVSPPGGTTFHLFLPPAGDAQAAASDDFRPPRAVARLSLQCVRVLVLDDEAAVRQGMEALLTALGAEVVQAADVEEARQVLVADPPDMLLADVNLRAGATGIAAIAALRQLRPGLPSILITGDTAPMHSRAAGELAVPLLHKPVTMAALLQAFAAQGVHARETDHER